MVPFALLFLVVGAGLLIGFSIAFGQINRLETRVRELEEQTRELVSLISGAIIDQDDRERLEFKIKQLLKDK